MKKLLLLVLVFFWGCQQNVTPKIGKKSFDKEDDYIIRALYEEGRGNLADAVEIYRFLYNKTKKDIYFEKIVSDLFYMKKYKEVVDLTDKFLQQRFIRGVFIYRILSLIKLNKIEEAKKELLTKYNKKEKFFYQIMAYIYIKEKNYEKAAEYLKSLYALDKEKKTLLQLTDVLIKLKKYNEAFAYLRTRLNLYGCEYDVCLRLVVIYKQLNDYDSLADIYKKMSVYNKKYLILALRIYIDEKEYSRALKLIRHYNLPEEYRLIVYEAMGNYKKAAYSAYKIYKKTKDELYLLRYCTYLYRAEPSKKTVIKIAPHLERLAVKYKDPFIYNFLGYILIDHKVNVKKGLDFAKKAVELSPDNQEYIDSLAWGYYMLGDCKSAWDIIQNVNLKDDTVFKHKRLIKKCLKREANDIRRNNKQNKTRFAKNKK